MAEKEKLALYRLWRPQTFDEVVAQKQVVYPLQQSVVEGTFSHALLFSGTRGTGKTSLAKIFAKAINCLNPREGNPCNACDICREINSGALMDISEIDAASNNSVEHVRRLTDEIMFTPVRARYKVYIIDEAHMLSTGAFNALLKTLEEPPEHAVFVLATTEPHRIPATIISRCQHYKFRRIPIEEIATRLLEIAHDIDLDITDDALESIAHLSNGALRDAISLLDQSRQIAKRPVERDDVLEIAGRVPDEFLSETASSILFQDQEILLINVQNLVLSGRDLTRFVTDLSAYFRNLLVCKVSRTPDKLILLRDQDIDTLRTIAEKASTSAITYIIEGLAELLVSMRFTPDLRTTLEIGLLRLASKFGNTCDQIEDVSISMPEDSETLVYDNAKKPFDIGEKTSPSSTVLKDRRATNVTLSDSLAENNSPEVTTMSNTSVEDSNSANSPSKDAITTHRGTESLIAVWSSILESLQQERRVEVALCARPAQVSLSDNVLNIHFRKNLTGQYACLSDDDNRLEIERLLTKRIGRPIQCKVTIGTKANKNDQSSEEQNWLSKLRDKVVPITDIPVPDPAHDMTVAQSDLNNNDSSEIRSRIDSTSGKSDKTNDTLNQISFDGSLLVNERDEVHKANKQSVSNDSKEDAKNVGLADLSDSVKDTEMGCPVDSNDCIGDTDFGRSADSDDSKVVGLSDSDDSVDNKEVRKSADSKNREEDIEVHDQIAFVSTGLNDYGKQNSTVIDVRHTFSIEENAKPSHLSKKEASYDDILQDSATNEQPWLIQLRKKIAAINDKSSGTSHQENNLSAHRKQIELRSTTLSPNLRKNMSYSENLHRAGNNLSPSENEQIPSTEESYNRHIPPHLHGDYDIPYFDEQDVPPLTDDDAPYF